MADGELASLTKRDAVFLWASQSGSAHQDWELSEELERFLSKDMLTINDRSPSAYWLRSFTERIVEVADTTLEKLTPERIEQRVKELGEASGAIS
jgi:hypothetical protein